MTFRYRKLDNNGDMIFGRGRNDYYIDVPVAVAQSIKTRLELWTGEWFLNTAEGTAWDQIAGTTGTNNTVRDMIIRTRILRTPYVINIYDWSSSGINRIYSASCKVVTEFGNFEMQIMAQPGAMPEFTWGGFPIAL